MDMGSLFLHQDFFFLFCSPLPSPLPPKCQKYSSFRLALNASHMCWSLSQSSAGNFSAKEQNECAIHRMYFLSRSGPCLFWTVSVLDCVCSGLCLFRTVSVPDRVCFGLCLFRTVSVPDRVCSGLCLFRTVSVPDCVCSGPRLFRTVCFFSFCLKFSWNPT